MKPSILSHIDPMFYASASSQSPYMLIDVFSIVSETSQNFSSVRANDKYFSNCVGY